MESSCFMEHSVILLWIVILKWVSSNNKWGGKKKNKNIEILITCNNRKFINSLLKVFESIYKEAIQILNHHQSKFNLLKKKFPKNQKVFTKSEAQFYKEMWKVYYLR